MVDALGLRRDNVRNVLKVGKSARHLCPTQSAGDEIEALPAAVEAVEDAFPGGVEFIDPVDSAPISCDVGGYPPIAGGLAGTEYKAEGGLGPLQEVQEPHGEGLSGAVLSPIPRGVVRGKGFKGVGIHLGFSPSHGPLSDGGVGWALLDEACQGPSSQVGDEEVRRRPLLGRNPWGAEGNLRGNQGVAATRARRLVTSLHRPQMRGLIGLGALEEGAGGDLHDLPGRFLGTPPGAEGLQDGEG